jgi:hypothetical protein
MESILNSIKKLLGPTEDYTHFDPDIVLHINSAFANLHQLGVGPEEGFTITDSEAKWSDYLEDKKTLEFVKAYIYLKVRLVFDPPTIGSVMESVKEAIKEYEWRITVAVDELKKKESEAATGNS